MKNQLVAVLGRGVVTPDTPVATADDLGLVRGDGCFDATLVRPTDSGFQVFELDDHLERLADSAALMAIPCPDAAQWRALVDEAIASWQGGEAALKLVLTRGNEHGDGKPTAFLTLTELGESFFTEREGIKVVTLSRGYPSNAFANAPWLLGGAKTISYAINVGVKREAMARGADDVILVSTDGFVLEAPTAVVIWRVADRLYSTPLGDTGILDSISRRKVFAAAANAGFETHFVLGTPADLSVADGVWLVSSVRGVAPVLELDGTPIAHDREATELIRSFNGF